MDLFPIGAVSTSASTGTIDGLTYSMFEPNDGCKSEAMFSNLTTQYDNTIRQTRQKAGNVLSTKYSYMGIYTKEYRQIEAFIETLSSGNLNSFYAIAWDRIITPSQIVVADPDWTISLYDTRYFSTINHYKAYDVFVWNGTNFRIGQVTTITAGTSIVIDVSQDLGGLSLADATYDNTPGTYAVYPIYEMYTNSAPLANLKSDSFIPATVDSVGYGGYTYSGDMGFNSKYTV